MQLKQYLKTLAGEDGSDLYISVGAPPSAKFQGKLRTLHEESLGAGDTKAMAYSVMDDHQIRDFEKELEMNLAISEPGVGRFRVNIFKQRNEISMVIRNIKMQIPDLNQLGLPEVLKKVIMEKRGLVLFVGGTGSGKSTSLAALIDYRNTNSGGHIITIEDPVEFIHPHKMSIVNQREVGVDTLSYHKALKNTLRQGPDVILIGEIRDQETMEHALAFAETGHLCISTLHANNANQALDRIINFFPEERRPQLLNDLSLNLKSFISQRLIPTVDGKRVAAIEILMGTPTIAELIKRGELLSIKEVMEKSESAGMQTFDRALFKLYRDGKIGLEETLQNADSPNNVRLMIKLAGDAKASQEKTQAGGLSLSLEEKKEEKPEEQPGEPVRVSLNLHAAAPPPIKK